MILVTGGAGFIGSNFILDWLSLHDEPVLNLDKLTYAGNLDNFGSVRGDSRHVFVAGDIADAALLGKLLRQYQPRAIINFAAESHVDRSISGADDFVQTNVVGVFRLLEVARTYWSEMQGERKRAFRFLQVSTDEVYGSLSSAGAAFRETDRYEPNSPYSASKAAADHFVRASFRTFGLPVLTTNCANNYGPYQFPEKLIPLMICRALAGEELPVYGDGLQVRDWLYVKDHCKAIRMVLEGGKPGETYNVGCNDERRNIDVVHAICHVLDKMHPRGGAAGYAAQIVHVTDRPGHDVRYAINADKIRSELGWEADQTFQKGLEQTVGWYLENPGWIAAISRQKMVAAA